MIVFPCGRHRVYVLTRDCPRCPARKRCSRATLQGDSEIIWCLPQGYYFCITWSNNKWCKHLFFRSYGGVYCNSHDENLTNRLVQVNSSKSGYYMSRAWLRPRFPRCKISNTRDSVSSGYQHREESWKYDARWSIFDGIRGVCIADETLSRLFDISS